MIEKDDTAEMNLVRGVNESTQFEDVLAALKSGGCILDQCRMRFPWDECFGETSVITKKVRTKENCAARDGSHLLDAHAWMGLFLGQ